MPEIIKPILLAVDGKESIIIRDIDNARLKELKDADHMWQISLENGRIEVKDFEVRTSSRFVNEL